MNRDQVLETRLTQPGLRRLVLFADPSMTGADSGTPRFNRPMRRCYQGGLFMATAFLLTACAGPTVISTPNSCTTLLPTHWRDGVLGAELPSGDTVADWIVFGDAQTGKLDTANGRTRDAIDIVAKCEDRDAKAVRRSTKSWLGRLFD